MDGLLNEIQAKPDKKWNNNFLLEDYRYVTRYDASLSGFPFSYGSIVAGRSLLSHPNNSGSRIS